jgi:hypothetical protein
VWETQTLKHDEEKENMFFLKMYLTWDEEGGACWVLIVHCVVCHIC